MEYIQYIEESQTWKCPKTGKWKITCVGGGHPELLVVILEYDITIVVVVVVVVMCM